MNPIIVVDFSSGLKILKIDLKPEPKLSAVKIIKTGPEEKEEEIVCALGDFLKQNRVPRAAGIFSPSLDSLFLKRARASVPEARLLDELKEQIKADLPFDPAEAIIDLQILSKYGDSDGKEISEAMVCAGKKEDILRQLKLLNQAGLTCKKVIPIPFGYIPFLGKNIREGQLSAVLDLGEENSYLALFKDNKLNFYRRISVSLSKFREVLRGTLVTEKGKIQLTADEIEEILVKTGIPEDGSVLAMMRPSLEKLGQEIKHSLSYYEARPQKAQPQDLFLSGKASSIPGLDKFLIKELSLNVSSVRMVDIAESETLACSGLAKLTDCVNLLPQEMRYEKIDAPEKVSLLRVSLIASLLFVISYISAIITVNAYKTKLDNALLRQKALSEVKDIQERDRQFAQFVKRIDAMDVPVGSIFKKLSNISPKQLFLEDLKLDCENRTGSISGFIKDTGNDSDSILAKFLQSLGDYGYFKDIEVISFEKTTRLELKAANFKIGFKL